MSKPTCLYQEPVDLGPRVGRSPGLPGPVGWVGTAEASTHVPHCWPVLDPVTTVAFWHRVQGWWLSVYPHPPAREAEDQPAPPAD